jgi:hypothetical protein
MCSEMSDAMAMMAWMNRWTALALLSTTRPAARHVARKCTGGPALHHENYYTDVFCSGTRTGTFEITQEAMFGGAACSNADGEEGDVACDAGNCPV